MQRVKSNIIKSKVDSFDTVLSTLSSLDTLLPKNNLYQFELFNKAYFIVTKAIQESARKKFFDNPEFVEQFTVCFARYYFDAVNKTAVSDPTLPSAWKYTSRLIAQQSTPKFIFLLMGANAHINHDLPLVLLDIMKREKTEDLLSDVFKIDKLLMKSGKVILNSFNEPNPKLNYLKRHCVFLYFRPTMYIILYWRICAWRSYKQLKKVGLQQSNYQKRSTRIAKQFLRLAKA